MRNFVVGAFAMLAAAWCGRATCERRAGRRGRVGADVHQGHCADLLRQLHVVPSARRNCADVAPDLQGCASVGQVDRDARSLTAPCRRGTPIRSTASSSANAA